MPQNQMVLLLFVAAHLEDLAPLVFGCIKRNCQNKRTKIINIIIIIIIIIILIILIIIIINIIVTITIINVLYLRSLNLCFWIGFYFQLNPINLGFKVFVVVVVRETKLIFQTCPKYFCVVQLQQKGKRSRVIETETFKETADMTNLDNVEWMFLLIT
jgi:hypothetical protein